MCRFPCFRERLNQLLIDSGKTIVDFAKTLGTSRQSLGYYLNGERIPDAHMLRQICERCNVSADWLLGLSDVKKPDADLQAVSEYTKLSADSIESLSFLNEHHVLSFLNDILSNNHTRDAFVILLLRMLYSCFMTFSEPGERYTASVSEKEFALYNCMKQVDILVNSICEEYPELKSDSNEHSDPYFAVIEMTRKAADDALDGLSLFDESNQEDAKNGKP